MLTAAEQNARTRAQQLLERTAYDAEDAPQQTERVTDARAVARALLTALDDLTSIRSAVLAQRERNDTLQAIIGKAAYRACIDATALEDEREP